MSEWLGDFAARRQRSRARRSGFDAAVASVRSSAQGGSRIDVRQLLVTELRVRGIDSPADPVMEHLIDRVVSPADLASQVRLTGRGLSMIASTMTGGHRDHAGSGGPHLYLGDADPLLIGCDRSRPGAEVVLDPGAQHWLEPREVRDGSAVLDSRDVFVLLSEADPGQVAVRVGDHQVGVLSSPDSGAFRAFVDEGVRQGRPVVTEALRLRTSAGSWRLRVYWPAAPGLG